jgi:hypothetical protein
MERRVNLDTWQKVTRDDFNNFGIFPQQSFDTVVGKLLIPDLAYSGFSVLQSGPAEVTVSPGHLFYLGKVYYNDQTPGTTVNLLARLPAATRRLIAITVWGTESDTDLEPRTFLTDAQTRATIARETATEHRRWANIGAVSGIEGPDPSPPAVAGEAAVVAWVMLSTTGIESITANEEMLTPTLREEDDRLNAFDLWRRLIGARLDTLASDLAALAKLLLGTARQYFVLEIVRDVARLKNASNLPSKYTAWSSDHFLDWRESDAQQVDWLARIDEGIRFPPASQRSDQLGTLNAVEPQVIIQDEFLLPKWTEIARLDSLGNDDELPIAQYGYQNIDIVQKTRVRARYRYGPLQVGCTNWIWYTTNSPTVMWDPTHPSLGFSTYDPISGIYRWGEGSGHEGEVWEILPEDRWKIGVGEHGAGSFRYHQVWQDGWTTEAYWDYVITNETVGGAVLAQTFLNSQDGWHTSVDFYFTRVAAAGDVQLMICETLNGVPDFSKVIARASISAALIKTFPNFTNIPTIPTFLKAGNRYAYVLSTPGNHYVAVLKGNKFAQGSLFYSTDGAWSQGDPVKDVAFRSNYAHWDQTRFEINMRSLQLEGGIATVDILADAFSPPMCKITHEVNFPSLGWTALDTLSESDPHPFVGLFPLLQYRIVFLGTTDVMPGIGVGVNSRVNTERARSDYKHISTVRTMPIGSPVNTVYVDLRLEHWRGAPYHTVTCKLLTGATYATVELPDASVDVIPPDEDEVIIRKYTFNLPASVPSYRIRIEGTTDNTLTCYLVAERIDIGVQLP